MKPIKSLHPRARFSSFRYAFQGWVGLVRSEPNAKIHFVATIVVIIAGFMRHISRASWLAVIIAVAMVWITEALNTAVEALADYACNKEYDPRIKLVKDVAAGAVLIASVAAVIIAVIVFVPF